jgi:hypothetical protein
VARLASQPALLQQVASQSALLERASELQEQLPGPQQERAQELRASPQALLEREREASRLQARDVLPVAVARAPPEAFSVPLWPPLPWLRDPLRRLPRHPRHPSNDDELFQQLRR